MGGGYIQLSAIGEQNAYLTGNPQITFFKSVYRRHTNFSIDLCRQVINGNDKKAFGEKLKIVVNRYGDLLSNIYVDNKLTLASKDMGPKDYLTWTNGIGYAILKEYCVSIGQNLIDTQNGEWLDIYNKMSQDNDNNNASLSYRQINNTNNNNNIQTLSEDFLKNHNNLNTLTGNVVPVLNSKNTQTTISTRTITELKFWFCRYYGQALPLIALNNLDVVIDITFRPLNELINTTNEKILDKEKTHVEPTVWCEYIFLDSNERRRFNTDVHEYLIEQVQMIEREQLPSNINANVNINLKNITNCVKSLFWVPHMKNYIQNTSGMRYTDKLMTQSHSTKHGNNWFNYSVYLDKNDNNTDNLYLFKCGQLLLNNEQRTPLLPAMYFANTQAQKHFNLTPFSNYIYTYSFALYPYEHQPSGTCNFSRFDSIGLSLNNIMCNSESKENHTNYSNSNYINIYALTYNVLLIHSGTAQLKY